MVSLEAIASRLKAFDAMLAILAEKGATHTQDLAELLRSNESLEKTFGRLTSMIEADLAHIKSSTSAMGARIPTSFTVGCFQNYFQTNSTTFGGDAMKTSCSGSDLISLTHPPVVAS